METNVSGHIYVLRRNLKNEMKKRSEAHKHCALAVETTNFRPAADPFSGPRDDQNLIS